MELHSAKTTVEVRIRPTEGNIQIELRGDIQGDKMGMGQLVADQRASGIGHQVHVHGISLIKAFEEWLQGDGRMQQSLPLPLTLAKETCLPWRNHLGMDLCGIPAGEFYMGASSGDPEAQPDEPRRRVHLTHGFWMALHPMTNAEYQRITGAPSPVTLPSHGSPQMPVANLTWHQAMDACQLLTAQEKAAGTLPPATSTACPRKPSGNTPAAPAPPLPTTALSPKSPPSNKMAAS